jgi:heme exporter protein D
MIKKFLNLGTGAWKERRLKGTYLRYYIENPEDGRNIVARWLDFLGVIFLTWALSFLLLEQVTRTQRTFLWSAVVLVIGLIIIDVIKRRQLRKKILNTRRKLARESYLEEINHMEDTDFADFATGLLQKYGLELSGEAELTDQEMLTGIFEKAPVWVKLLFENNTAVFSNLKKILGKAADSNYNAVIIVVKDQASNELLRIIESFRNSIHIEIVDKNRLAKMAAHIDHPSSSSLPEHFSELKEHQEREKRRSLRKEIIGTRQKTRGYGLSALLLFFLFAFLESSALISITYLVFAMINTALAATSFIMERHKKQVQLLKP